MKSKFYSITNLPKVVFSLLLLATSYTCISQEFGYISGLSKIGIDAQNYQPLYGITFGKNFNQFFSLESNVIYSQRTVGSATQADYLSFILIPKFGYWKNKFGAYYSPAIALNPTLHHADIKNHTYVSTFQCIGFQFNISPKVSLDAKGGYDIGLTKGYLNNGSFQKYNGIILIGGLRFKLH